MQIGDCNMCCKRWFVTFNGSECSPVPIDIVVYLNNKDSSYSNFMEPRILAGHCKIPSKSNNGTSSENVVNVGFNIGHCRGFGPSDGYTGWNSAVRIFVEEVNRPFQ